MEFDRAIIHSSITTDKHLVGLAIYYLDEMQDEAPVEVSTIRHELEQSRADVNLSNVSSYPSQLADDGYVKKRNGGYVLTHDGKQHYMACLDLPEAPEEPHEDLFLELEYDSGPFYDKLIENINTTYQYRVYDATLVLTRKLLESMLIDLLRGEFGREGTTLYFNPDTAQYRGLAALINNFEEQSGEYRKYSLTVADDEFIELLESFRQDGNASAHSIEINITEEEIKSKSDDATRIVNILMNIWKKVQLVNEDTDD